LTLFKAEGRTPENYHGAEILSTGGKGKAVSQAVVFLSDSIVAMGDLESVRAAVDRRTAASALDPALAAKIDSVSAQEGAWVVSIVPISSLASVAPDRNVKGALQGDLIKAIQQSSGGIKFGNTIEINGELTARTDQDASSLADVLRFFMNMAQMSSPTGGHPE